MEHETETEIELLDLEFDDIDLSEIVDELGAF